SRTSNRYRLAVDTPQDKLSGAPDVHGREEVTDDLGTRTPAVRGPGHPCPAAPDTGVLVTTTEPSLEPSPPPPASDRPLAPDLAGGGGEFFYPKDLTPKQRQALQERLTVVAPEHAQRILDELAGRMAISQVQNPIRYCATLIERLQRGKFLPELGLKVADARRAEDARRTALAQFEKSAPGS